MKNNKQHVQVPNNMIKKNGFEPKDLLIYATLKKYMNNETKECFPSLETLSKESGYSINTVRKAIDSLKENEYINVWKKGRQHIYKFNPYKKFEPFSYDFLESNKIEANEKAYILACQQFLIKDREGIGKTSFTNSEISEKLNISTKTISRLDNSLVKKGFLNIIKTNTKNPDTGLYVNEKFFHLDELGQAIIWTLQKHDNDIEELKEVTENHDKDLKIVLRENEQIKNDMNKLLQRIKKLENGEIYIDDENVSL